MTGGRGQGHIADAEELATSALVAVLSGSGAGRGLWRAWVYVYDAFGRASDPVPVYLAHWAGDGSLAPVEQLRGAARVGGSRDAGVEVVTEPDRMTALQREIRAQGDILWTRERDSGMRLAPVFDGVDDAGTPYFDPRRPLLTDLGERTRVLEYMRGAAVLLATSDTAGDVLNPECDAKVPMNVRTDGVWIWADASEYYLEQHWISPEEEFLTYIHSMNGQPAPLEPEVVDRALDSLIGRS